MKKLFLFLSAALAPLCAMANDTTNMLLAAYNDPGLAGRLNTEIRTLCYNVATGYIPDKVNGDDRFSAGTKTTFANLKENSAACNQADIATVIAVMYTALTGFDNDLAQAQLASVGVGETEGETRARQYMIQNQSYDQYPRKKPGVSATNTELNYAPGLSEGVSRNTLTQDLSDGMAYQMVCGLADNGVSFYSMSCNGGVGNRQ